MYDLPDIAWHDPALLLRGQLPSQLSRQKNPGKRVTNNLAASKHKMLEESQVDTRAETSIALPTMVSLGSRASFRGRASSFSSHGLTEASGTSPDCSFSHPCLRRKLSRDCKELATNSFKAVSPELVPYQLACFTAAWQSLILYSLCVSAYLTYTLTAFTEQLCRQQSAEKSFQLRTELSAFHCAAYALMAQFQDSPTRARQLQLSIAQLCFANSVWLKASKLECSTRASQLQLGAFRTGTLQEPAFQQELSKQQVQKQLWKQQAFQQKLPVH